MTDLHARLAENQQIIEATAEGPWAVEGWIHVCQVTSRSDRGIAKASFNEDASFIATARTEWPKENAALRKVLELHKLDDQEECAVCTNDYGEPLMWPCPTVKAIEEEMSGAGPSLS